MSSSHFSFQFRLRGFLVGVLLAFLGVFMSPAVALAQEDEYFDEGYDETYDDMGEMDTYEPPVEGRPFNPNSSESNPPRPPRPGFNNSPPPQVPAFTRPSRSVDDPVEFRLVQPPKYWTPKKRKSRASRS